MPTTGTMFGRWATPIPELRRAETSVNDARWANASVDSVVNRLSPLWPRQRPNRANVRSTIERLGRTARSLTPASRKTVRRFRLTVCWTYAGERWNSKFTSRVSKRTTGRLHRRPRVVLWQIHPASRPGRSRPFLSSIPRSAWSGPIAASAGRQDRPH
jgi:hypothetical protein